MAFNVSNYIDKLFSKNNQKNVIRIGRKSELAKIHSNTGLTHDSSSKRVELFLDQKTINPNDKYDFSNIKTLCK